MVGVQAMQAQTHPANGAPVTPASTYPEASGSPAAVPPALTAVPSVDQSHYILSPGDVLEISVFNAPDLSQRVVVNSAGNIYKYTGGVQSTFATGLFIPISMAFDSAGDLFVGTGGGDNGAIIKITPGGTQSTFATGLSFPGGLAFDGPNLLVTEQDSGTIFQYTPGGVQSTFATTSSSALNGLAFNSAGDLFVASAGTGSIIEIAPGGAQSTFASGLGNPAGIAFQPVPEPSVMALGAIGALAFFARRRR